MTDADQDDPDAGTAETESEKTESEAEAEESDAEESEAEETEFELEGVMPRERGATVLRRLADEVERGSVDLGREEGPVTVPDGFEVEVEYEVEGDEAELEAELTWSLVDGEPAPPDEDE